MEKAKTNVGALIAAIMLILFLLALGGMLVFSMISSVAGDSPDILIDGLPGSDERRAGSAAEGDDAPPLLCEEAVGGHISADECADELEALRQAVGDLQDEVDEIRRDRK